MDILNTWRKLQQDPSISKTLVLFKSLLETHSDFESSDLSLVLSEIFEKLTLYLVNLYTLSDTEGSLFLTAVESLIPLSQDLLFRLNLCEFYNTLGTLFRKQGQPARAFKLLQKGLDLSYLVPNPSLIKVFLNLNIAGILSHSSKHKKALKFAVMASELAEELLDLKSSSEDLQKIQEAVCIAYHTVGVQHEFLLNLTSALEWYSKAWDFGKKTINEQNIDLIQKIEDAVKAVRLKFHKNFVPKPKTRVSRNRPASQNFSKTMKSFNLSRTVFSTSGQKARTFGKNLQKSFSRSSFSKASLQSRQSSGSKASSSPQLFESRKEDLVDESSVKEPENYFKNVLESLEQKLLQGNKETIACQTDQSSLTPYVLNNFRQIQSADFDYSFVEIAEPSAEVPSNTLKPAAKTVDLHRALVKWGKIDIHFKEYEVRYYINSALTVLYVKVTNDQESYEFTYDLVSDDSIMEVIDKVIHSKIDLVSQKLCLVEITSFNLIKGMHVRNDSEIKVSITQRRPRADLNVVFQCVGSSFRGEFKLIDMLQQRCFKNLEPQFIFSCFSIENESIVLKFPSKETLDLIYYKHHVLNNGYSYFIKISEIAFETSKCFLIEGVSNSSPAVLPLLAELDLICRLAGLTESVMLKNIEKIPALICVRQSQLQFHQQKGLTKAFERVPTKNAAELSMSDYESLKQIVVKIQSVFRGSQVRKRLKKDEVSFAKRIINNIEFMIQIVDSPLNKVLKIRVTSQKTTYTLQFKYPIPFVAPFKETIPELVIFHEKTLVIKNPRLNSAFVFDNTAEFQTEKKIQEVSLESDSGENKNFPQDFYGKIHFRTCVIREKLMRQISMTLTKSERGEDLAEFHILSGTAKDDWQRFVIDLKSISEKSGIEKSKLTAIGYYVVRHMLFHGDGNMVCIDFESNIDDFERNLIRVQAAIRGKLLRKRLKINKRVVLNKKKVTISNSIWTVMLMKDSLRFYLVLVKGFTVLKKILNLSGFSRDGIIQDFDLLMRKVIIPEIKLLRIENRWMLSGIEKYED